MPVNMLYMLPEFRKFINASLKGKRSKYPGRKLSRGTITQYECVFLLLLEFQRELPSFLTIVLDRRFGATSLKKEKKYWQNFLRHFLRFLYQDKGYFDNYVVSVLKVIRVFFNYLKDEKGYPISHFYKWFKVRPDQFAPIVLEPKQLEFLIRDKSFEASLSPVLQRTKDIFVFGCTVGLRYSDLIRLKREQLIIGSGSHYLIVHTVKTGALVKLPLPPYLLAIVKKYQKVAGRYLFPRISSTNLNLQIKKLAERAGWNYPLPKIRLRGGKPVQIKNAKNGCLTFAQQLTTHTMRRTAITTLLVMGVPEYMVRRISGHAPNSKEFYRYIAIAQDFLDYEVLKAYDRLAGDAQA